MEGIRAWLQDRKNLPIVAGGTALIIIVVALVFLKMTGTIGGQAGPDTTAYQPPAGPAGQPPPIAPIGSPETVGVPGVPGASVPGGVPPTPDVSAGAAAVAAQPPILPYRKDPFLPFGGPPRRASVLMHLLPSVSRPRITTYTVKHEVEEWELPAEVLPPQPFRRMTGVMYNGHVSAILETAGEYDIVRPGMEIRRANTRVMVESIQPTSITLKTLDTATPMTINVNLAGSVAAGAGAPAGPAPGGYPTDYGVPGPGGGAVPGGVINP